MVKAQIGQIQHQHLAQNTKNVRNNTDMHQSYVYLAKS